MKYDCTKTIDCIHEFRRRCDSIGCNYACPFWGTDNCTLDFFDEDKIALLQKWSDEHPEQLKLSKREREFIEGFCDNSGMSIKRISRNVLYVCQYTPFVNPNTIMLNPSMFSFIHVNEEWDFLKLLSLEVVE